MNESVEKETARGQQRIVDGAAKLVTERGIEGASVADVMSEAGLTQGGYYRHFDTKHWLVDAALQTTLG